MSLWYAFRTDEPARVVEYLKLQETRSRSFAERVTSLVGVEETMFVTPAVNGWVLAFGEWPPPTDDLKLRVELASIRFGEAQAFGSDDTRGRRAWLRATDGACLRALVFDGQGYPLSQGARTPGEPLFPQLLATPSDKDVHRMARTWSIDPREVDFPGPGILGKRNIIERVLEKGPNESKAHFAARIGIVYMQHRWDADVPPASLLMQVQAGSFRVTWPSDWGKPGCRCPWMAESSTARSAGTCPTAPASPGAPRQAGRPRRLRGNGDPRGAEGTNTRGACGALSLCATLVVDHDIDLLGRNPPIAGPPAGRALPRRAIDGNRLRMRSALTALALPPHDSSHRGTG